MKIVKGDKNISIPGWALFIGLIVVDNIASNICTVINNKTVLKSGKKEGSH
jgi:hypothetical protein